jgi:hypothetical protein
VETAPKVVIDATRRPAPIQARNVNPAPAQASNPNPSPSPVSNPSPVTAPIISKPEDRPRERKDESVSTVRKDEVRPNSERRSEDRPRREERRGGEAIGNDNRPKPRNDKPSHSSGKSLEDLRSVLAKLSVNDNKNEAKKSDGKSVENKIEAKEIERKNNLADALGKISGGQTGVVAQKENSIVDNETESEGRKIKVVLKSDEMPAQTINPNHASADFAKAEIKRLAAEAEVAFASLAEKQPIAEPDKDDPLAPKKLERMFRQPKDERSPFSS